MIILFQTCLWNSWRKKVYTHSEKCMIKFRIFAKHFWSSTSREVIFQWWTHSWTFTKLNQMGTSSFVVSIEKYFTNFQKCFNGDQHLKQLSMKVNTNAWPEIFKWLCFIGHVSITSWYHIATHETLKYIPIHTRRTKSWSICIGMG